MEKVKDIKDIVYKGTFEEINDFFYTNGWTDGLPIIPPTTEKVEEMLSWTDLAPDTEIGVLQQANRMATPWNIAVNGVMAGCRPEYMPVLIAAVEAMMEPSFRLKDLGSTGSIKAFIVINGPLIKQLDINYGTSLMAPGRKSNATIGRALYFVIKNIAGYQEGVTWVGTFGWPGHVWVLAEDEEASPWQPFHVDRGFDRNTSVVTIGMVMNATYQVMSSGSTAAPHLKALCCYVGKAFGTTCILVGMSKSYTIFISPPNAQVIASSGYSRQDVKEYVAENAKLLVDEVNEEFAYTEGLVVPRTVHGLVMEGKAPKKFDVSLGEKMPIVESPDIVDIFVCGSRARNRNMVFRNSYAHSSTREIKLPANWESRLKNLR